MLCACIKGQHGSYQNRLIRSGFIKTYVDGKPRYDATSSHRAVSIPEGSPDDYPQAETVDGLGNRMDELVNKIIEVKGVEPYEESVELVHQLRGQGFKIAVVTSSQNCTAVAHLVVNDLGELVS